MGTRSVRARQRQHSAAHCVEAGSRTARSRTRNCGPMRSMTASDHATVRTPPRLLDQVRNALRVRHRSARTEKAYLHWITRFIRFHGIRHPRELGKEAVSAFLSDLAVSRRVSASTQAQALSALLFLYRHVLGTPLPWLDQVERAKKPVRLPVVLSRAEVALVLGQLNGTPWLVASLLYGSGLRLLEACRLRIKDIDFDARVILVRDGKGRNDRRIILPGHLMVPLATQRDRVEAMLRTDQSHAPRRSNFQTRSRASTQAHHANSHGSGCSPPAGPTSKPRRGAAIGTTSTRPSFSAPLPPPSALHPSPSMRAAIPSATASPPTSSSAVPISAQSRNCSATETSAPPRSTRTSSTEARSECKAPWTKCSRTPPSRQIPPSRHRLRPLGLDCERLAAYPAYPRRTRVFPRARIRTAGNRLRSAAPAKWIDCMGLRLIS
jgi:hypothetical protein